MLRRHTRPITREGHGSCNRQLLMKGGYFTRTRAETGKRNAAVQPIEQSEKHGEDFSRELAAVESTALMPIYHRKELLGSFVIDSKQSYFFTERWQRIVRTVPRVRWSRALWQDRCL